MAWMESIGCVSCATNDGSAAAAVVEPYLLSKERCRYDVRSRLGVKGTLKEDKEREVAEILYCTG